MTKDYQSTNYEAPHVEVIEVNIEQGFATSYEPGVW